MKTRTLLLSLCLICQVANAGWFKRKPKVDLDSLRLDSIVSAMRIDITDSLAMVFADSLARIPRPITLADTIQDSSIVVPFAMQQNIDTLLTNWFESSYVHFEDDCIENDAELQNLPDSLYIARLAAMPTLIEMPYNPVVKRYIELYTHKVRKLTQYMLGLSPYYFPMFEQELEQAGMPLELKYLPLIESALKPEATSRAGAAGLWQFMVATARYLGMEVNSLVDERRDPMLSSKMAVAYLQDLYQIYGDWSLAIAAYNCGPGNVNKAISRSGGKRDYWQLYYYLPRETRGYVPAFIAVNYAMTYYQEHDICPARVDMPLAGDTVMVNHFLYFEKIATTLDMPIELLRTLNPQYRNDVVPGSDKAYPLYLPTEQVTTFLSLQDSIVAQSDSLRRKVVTPGSTRSSVTNLPSGDYIVHRISSGESLSTIAARYGTTVSHIKDWNGMYSTRITAGKTLRIYGQKTVVSQKPTVWKGDIGYYTVSSGDNLWLIAQKFKGVTIDQLKSLNKLASNSLKPGQVLKIPKV